MPPPKGIPIAPLTGILDVRSIADLLPPGALRWRQNFQTTGEGKLQRGVGWTKALSKSEYNNQDFHDQLLLFGGTVREPVTGLFEFQTSRGIRSLWLTTQSRIAKLNETTGNWKIIASGLGGGAGTDCSGPRFKAANVGDYVIFTNGYDRPKIHRLEQPPFDDVLIADIPDLETIGLTKAALVFAWRDTMILADVELDGERLGNTFVWGDFKNPPSFDPAKPESIAGNSSFNYGERILAGGETTAGTFLMYTTHGIWELTRVADDRVFAKREAYPGRKADFVGCLKYQNTVVDIGGDHLYMAKDGIYAFNPYRSAPELVLWLHRATSVLFDDIDESACAASIGWFHDGEAFWSAKRNSDSWCPGITLRVETQFHVADVVDHGFTAAVNYRPQPIQTIRDFILDKRICTLPCLTSELVAQDLPPPFENEGLPSPFTDPTAAFAPTHFYTNVTQTINGVVTEDWNQPSPSVGSLCALLGDITLDDLCQGCESVSVLIAASSQDWCLKQFGGFYRERFVITSAVGITAECDEVCAPDPCVDVDALSITTTELTSGTEGEAYSFQMEGSGGSGVYQWEITSGALPDGLTMDASGLISGTPTVAGTFEMGFTASDTTCMIDDATATLEIVVAVVDQCGPLPHVSLLAYYKCDEVAYPVLDSVGGKNLTDNGAGGPFPDVEPGIISTGFFGAAGTGVLRFGMRNTDPQWDLSGADGFTVRAWFWYSGSTSTLYTTNVTCIGAFVLRMFDPFLPTTFGFLVSAQASYVHKHVAAIPQVGWNRVIAILRPGCGTLLKVNNLATQFFPDVIFMDPGATIFQIAAPNDVFGFPKTGVDEVGVWRGAWSEAQMLYDWNGGVGRSYPDVPL